MSQMLGQHASRIGGLTNIDRQFVLNSLVATSDNHFLIETNSTGEVIDIWETPYRIELVGQTKFVIRSAGRNRTFGDKDDIIFDGTSNDFVKP